jgi:hypothetical protein
MAAPRIMGSALSWNARRRPIPSATEPLNRHPIKAPPKQMLTTSPSASVLPEKPRSAEMLSRGSLTTLRHHSHGTKRARVSDERDGRAIRTESGKRDEESARTHPEWYPKRNEVSVATQTCGSDMRHDGPATASVVALTAGNGENGFKISPLNFWVGEMGREDSVYELGVSTSGSMAASLDGTRLYTDELSFHRIAADPREEKTNKRSTSDPEKHGGGIGGSGAWAGTGTGSREIWAGLGGGEGRQARVGVLIVAVK